MIYVSDWERKCLTTNELNNKSFRLIIYDNNFHIYHDEQDKPKTNKHYFKYSKFTTKIKQLLTTNYKTHDNTNQKHLRAVKDKEIASFFVSLNNILKKEKTTSPSSNYLDTKKYY